MSCELALKIYEQAKDRLQQYVDQPPPAPGDRLATKPDERIQEVQRLRHAVKLAQQAYERAKAEHVEVGGHTKM